MNANLEEILDKADRLLLPHITQARGTSVHSAETISGVIGETLVLIGRVGLKCFNGSISSTRIAGDAMLEC